MSNTNADIQHAMIIGAVQDAAYSCLHTPPTYSTSVTGLVPATLGATDIFTIQNPVGSGIVVRVWVVALSGTAVTAITVDAGIVKRSSLNTGGTSTSPPAVPHDSNNPAALAVVKAYTANPTSLGTLVGVKRSVKFPLLLAGAAVSAPAFELYTRSGKPQQGYVLRPGELLGINFTSTVVIGGSVDAVFEWTESSV